jgi:ABC-type transporter Mla subunit MlaD
VTRCGREAKSCQRLVTSAETTLAEAQQTITRILAELEKADVEGMLATARDALDGSKTEGTSMVRNVTLLDLVNAVAEHARSEAEVIATVVWMVNQGHVRLCGTFKGARFDLTTITA